MRKMLVTLAALGLIMGVSNSAPAQETKVAIFAGGCFWCVEADFDHIPGVVQTISGYTGGSLPDPTYSQVSAGGTGHYEAVRVTYDPSQVRYQDLLTAFWHSVDPTDPDGQFCDRGNSYRTAIFVNNERQRDLAEESKRKAAQALGQSIVTPILPAKAFYAAEDYHQNYYKAHSFRYRFYRWSCGRNQRVEDLWGERAYRGIPGLE
jgi:peptide-methionine (S)-S-oxide reductase